MSYKGKTVVAIVPARGGSKGIPWKNLLKINGVTLTRRAIDCAKAVPEIDKVICSTDRERIGSEAFNGGTTIVKRPPELSGDIVSDAAVLRHCIDKSDIVVMIQPTCPQRKPEHISECITRLVDWDRDSVWTVSPVPLKYHCDKQLTLMGYATEAGEAVIARQQLLRTYYRNGACYAMTRHCLLAYGTMGPRWAPLILQDEFISIDTPEDAKRAGCEIPL